MLDAPDPLAPADRVCQLRTAELLVLAASRLWVAAYLDPAADRRRWRNGFRAAGLEDAAAQAFDALFEALAAGATRQIGFHCPTCACLGDDEASLLQVYGHLQRGRVIEARRLLLGWLAPGAVRVALGLAEAVAEAMAATGLRVPQRDWVQGPTGNEMYKLYQISKSVH